MERKYLDEPLTAWEEREYELAKEVFLNLLVTNEVLPEDFDFAEMAIATAQTFCHKFKEHLKKEK